MHAFLSNYDFALFNSRVIACLHAKSISLVLLARTDRDYSPEFSRMSFVQLLINPIIYHTQLRKEKKGTIQQKYFVLPCPFGFR